jgi:hypothetical protein
MSATTTKNRRRQKRHAIVRDDRASVEFDYPVPHGKTFAVPLVNVSASGLSFTVEGTDELTRLEEGTSLPGAVVRVGDCRIRGELLVMHVTADPRSGYVCGALFYPATDADLIMLKSVVAGMEVAGTD